MLLLMEQNHNPETSISESEPHKIRLRYQHQFETFVKTGIQYNFMYLISELVQLKAMQKFMQQKTDKITLIK